MKKKSRHRVGALLCEKLDIASDYDIVVSVVYVGTDEENSGPCAESGSAASEACTEGVGFGKFGASTVRSSSETRS